MKIFEDLKKKIKDLKIKSRKSLEDKSVKNGKNKKTQDVNKDLLNNLPPGVKIKKIEIGPKQIIKFVIYLILFFWVISTVGQLFSPQNVTKVPLSVLIENIKNNKASKLTVTDNDVMLTLKDGNKILTSSKESSVSMADILQKQGVDLSSPNLEFQVENRKGWKMLGDGFVLILTVVVPIMFILWLFKRQSGGAGGGMFGFGKSTAKLFVKGKQNLTFKDVAGVEEAKNDLVEVVDFLKHPEKYIKMGARAPKGVLLVGPSGVGKTLLAKAVAGEANVPFYSMAGSEFMEMLVGVGASSSC